MIGSCLVGCTGDSLMYNFGLYMLSSVNNTWIPFKNSSYYLLSGSLNSDLTILKNLFNDYPTQYIWKIQLNVYVVYSNQTFVGSTSTQVFVNFPPSSGLCNINPTNGTTNTIFKISCNGWTDSSGAVASYSFYGKLFFYFEF